MPIPDSSQYLLLMAGCLIITLPLEFLLGARVYRRPLRLVQAVLVTLIVFSVWDAIAIGAGMWTYSPKYTSGIAGPFGLPLEEIVFFVVIPICALLTYEAVGRVLAFLRGRARDRVPGPGRSDAGRGGAR
ncbi:lycopene cyclase domain-containing protein [Leucobacter zeae]|nr:lycopene cyclase domain-containing protein [Leucobacter zeae]